MENGLIETKEIGDYRIKIYYDIDADCPITSWDMVGKYLFEYNDIYHHVLHKECNWNDLFSDNRHSLYDALQHLASDKVSQEDIIKYLKSGKIDGVRFVYNQSSRQWELQVEAKNYKGEVYWSVEYEFEASELKSHDYRMELLESLESEDLITLIDNCAKDVVIKKWGTIGYSQGDYVSGIAYVTKENYDKYCGRKDVDWKEYALKCIDSEVKDLGMWMWGDVKGFVLEKKVAFTKRYKDEGREDEEGFDWERVDSCWGYYMEAEELIKEVISEHQLKEVA